MSRHNNEALEIAFRARGSHKTPWGAAFPNFVLPSSIKSPLTSPPTAAAGGQRMDQHCLTLGRGKVNSFDLFEIACKIIPECPGLRIRGPPFLCKCLSRTSKIAVSATANAAAAHLIDAFFAKFSSECWYVMSPWITRNQGPRTSKVGKVKHRLDHFGPKAAGYRTQRRVLMSRPLDYG